MNELIFFALWAAAIFLMMRLGCGAHVMGHAKQSDRKRSSDEEVRWVPPIDDTYPVCRKTVKRVDAKPSILEGHVFYFCSPDCREIFEAAPESHLDSRGGNQPKKLESSHV